MLMRTRVAASLFFCFSLLAAPASAQYVPQEGGNRATGENYHVEFGAYFWNPTPDIFVTSESIPGVLGTRIDFVQDLGLEKTRHSQIKAVLRPGTKHKLRFEYTPIKYEAEGEIRRTVVFNGITFPVALPVQTQLTWRAYRFGYEWDFLYKDRGFVGLVLEAKYTDIEATLTNVIDVEFVRARGPIPAIGVIGRGYVTSNISITGEFGMFKMPDVDEDYAGNFYDFDLYGTVNFTDNFGAQVGYRSLDLLIRIDNDEGDMKMKGFYFGGVARF
jgi:hypothetical protein